MMRVAVLGARGFLGRYVCNFLASKNVELIEADVQPPLTKNIRPQSNQIIFDVVKTIDYSPVVARADAIIYLVSTTLPHSSNLAPTFDVESNLISLIRLLEAVKHTKKKLIFSSSGGTVYGPTSDDLVSEAHPTNPICSYGIVKLACEKYLRLYRQLYGFQSLSLRIANPYGAGQDPTRPQGTIGVFTDKILNRQKISIWGDGNIIRDYVSAADVAESFWQALEYQGNAAEINIGTGIGTSINELIPLISKKCGEPAVFEYEDARTFDVPRNVLDNSLALQELHWSPKTSLESGIQSLIEEMAQKN